jgi:EAL domain-containing protein (putative c-di-GMP-specific phosphodiesterase class I)
MAYQLQADARTGQLVAAEALLRWRHPTYGAVSAPEAVALAERTGTQRRTSTAAPRRVGGVGPRPDRVGQRDCT